MARVVCPRCGGPAHLETETTDRRELVVTRAYVCDSCGQTFSARVERVRAPSSTGVFRGLAVLPIALLALWLLLRNPAYTERALLYDSVTSLLEAYRHPLWAGILAASAAALLAAGRRPRVEVSRTPLKPVELQVREEPGDRLAIIAPGRSSALGREALVARRAQQEAALLARLSELATRSVSFASRRSPAGTDDATRELHREIYSMGLELGSLLLGDDPGAADRVFDLPGDHLLLRIQPGLAHLPWELIVPRPGAEYLWQRFHVGRQVISERAPEPTPAWRGDRLRVLVLANLESTREGRALPAAESEASELAELAALTPELLRVIRRSPRSAEELRATLSEGFDVVHFAGHTVDVGGRAGWVLGAGEAVDPGAAISASGATPSLVFANSCGSGVRARMTGWTTDGPLTILEAGVGAHVATLWDLPDRQAAHMSRVFYRGLVAGRTVGESLTAARESHMGVSPFGWANYVLYGDPTARPLEKA